MGGSSGTIVMHASVAGYFKEELDKLCAARKVGLEDATGFYVVNLLSEFSRADRLFLPSEEGRSRELAPLAELLARAQDAVGEERAKLLRHLGDSSLYVGGFFQESLESRNVDVEYFVEMGGSAYSELSGTFGGTDRETMRGIYRELSAKFERVMELLSEMADLHLGLTDSANAIMKAYEKWQKTGSARLASRLRRRGVSCGPGGMAQ